MEQMTWQEWYEKNNNYVNLHGQVERSVKEIDHPYYCEGELIIPNYQTRICIDCGESFPAHTHKQIRCFKCHSVWLTAFLYYSTLKNEDRLRKLYPERYEKPTNPQLKLDL